MNTKIVKLDINRNLYDTLTAKQGDTQSRFLLFQLLDGAIPFSLENRSVKVFATKPDGKEVFNDLIINDRVKGYCTLELTNQMLAVPGLLKLELMVIEGEKKLTTNVFYMDVKKSINSENAIVSTNEFSALLNGLASLNEYDNYKNEIAAARDGEVNLLTKVKKIDEQLEHIETNLNNYKYLRNGLIQIPSEFPKIPFSIYKSNDGYYTDFDIYKLNDWNGALEIFISNNASSGDGLSPNRGISLGRFIYNLENNIYGENKKFILNIIDNIHIETTGMTLTTHDVEILIRSKSSNGFSWIGRFERPNKSGETTTAWIQDSGVYKIKQSKNYDVIDMFNTKCNDYKGMPRPYKKVSSLNECINEKGTFYQLSGSVDVYCNPHNNHNINECLLVVSKGMVTVNSNVKSKVFLQNVGFPSNAFRHNTTSIDSEIYIDGCKFFRNPNDALSLKGIYKAYLNNSVASYGSKDGFNYHSTSEETVVVEVNCCSFGNGKLKMNGGNTSTHSNNGSTAHDGISILRAGADYFDCQGPLVADVGDCLSVNFGCSAFDIAEGNSGHKSSYLFENVNKKAYVIDCKGGGENTDYGVKGDSNTIIIGFNGKRIYNGKVNVEDIG